MTQSADEQGCFSILAFLTFSYEENLLNEQFFSLWWETFSFCLNASVSVDSKKYPINYANRDVFQYLRI